MTTPSDKTWDVIPATERITVDSRRQAETTVKVVNLGPVPRRATLTITTDPTAATWFTVTEPERTVDPGASATYPVTVTVPPEVPAAAYAFQVTVHSSDGPPETPSYSPQVILEIPAAQAVQAVQPVQAARPPFKLAWLAAPAALLLVAAGVVTAVVVARPSPPQHQAQPSPTVAEPSSSASVGPSEEVPPGLVTVPDVTSLDEDNAVSALAAAGLTPVVQHRHDPANAGLILQNVPAGVAVTAGTAVVLEVSVRLSQPTFVSPAIDQRVEYVQQPSPALSNYDAVQVWINWIQPESYVTRWQLTFGQFFCYRDISGQRNQFYVLTDTQIATTTSITTLRYFRSAPAIRSVLGPCHREFVQIAPLDDFGNVGPSDQRTYYAPKYDTV